MKYKYKAKLSQALIESGFPPDIAVPSVLDALDGFWTNGTCEFKHVPCEFTRGEDNIFFIMPSQILFIKKVEDE